MRIVINAFFLIISISVLASDFTKYFKCNNEYSNLSVAGVLWIKVAIYNSKIYISITVKMYNSFLQQSNIQ